MSDTERNDTAQGEERRLFTGQGLAGHHHLLPSRKAARSRSSPRSTTSCGQPRPTGCGRHRAEARDPQGRGNAARRRPYGQLRHGTTTGAPAEGRQPRAAGERAAPCARPAARPREPPPPRALAGYGLITRDPPAHRPRCGAVPAAPHPAEPSRAERLC